MIYSMRTSRVCELGGDTVWFDPSCPLCPENGKVDIIDDAETAYLVAAKDSPVEGCFLIIPKEHVTDFRELSILWWVNLQELLVGSMPWYTPDSPFNLSINSGRAAGQTLAHLHFWVIPRNETETSSSYGKGTATLIKEFNATAPVV